MVKQDIFTDDPFGDLLPDNWDDEKEDSPFDDLCQDDI